MRRWSAKGKCVCLHPRVEKFDLEGVVGNATAFANELIKPMLAHAAVSVGVDVGAVVRARCRPVDGHPEPDLFSFVRRSENKMQIARPEPIGDAAAFFVEGRFLFLDRPLGAERPHGPRATASPSWSPRLRPRMH